MMLKLVLIDEVLTRDVVSMKMSTYGCRRLTARRAVYLERAWKWRGGMLALVCGDSMTTKRCAMCEWNASYKDGNQR